MQREEHNRPPAHYRVTGVRNKQWGAGTQQDHCRANGAEPATLIRAPRFENAGAGPDWKVGGTGGWGLIVGGHPSWRVLLLDGSARAAIGLAIPCVRGSESRGRRRPLLPLRSAGLTDLVLEGSIIAGPDEASYK